MNESVGRALKDVTMLRPIRTLLGAEAAAFSVAASVHRGFLIDGYRHRQASIAESVIAAVLLAALAGTWVRPRWMRPLGVGAQAFALLGTMIGLAMIAIGIGPRSVPDVVYHFLITAVLIAGLVVCVRGRSALTTSGDTR